MHAHSCYRLYLLARMVPIGRQWLDVAADPRFKQAGANNAV